LARAPEPAEPPDLRAPRRNPTLLGHLGAEAAFHAAHRQNRLPHAWLLAGPEGIGKATFAFRAARWLLAGAPEAGPGQGALHLDPLHPVFARVAASGHSDLHTVERGVNEKTGRPRVEIVVDDVRDAIAALRLTPAEGTWRVAVFDPAEALNRTAENALLKTLEEPRRNTLLLLVSHAPGRLLPTTRSRVRTLRFQPLAEAELKRVLREHLPEKQVESLVPLADGSPGRALALAASGILELLPALERLLASMPGHDRMAAQALGDRLNKVDADQGFRALFELLSRSVAQAASARARGQAPGGLAATIAGRASLAALPPLWENLRRLGEDSLRASLDRKAAVLTALGWLDAAARGETVEPW